jgi:hypothetical protein
MPELSEKLFQRVLDPMERISELLFGTIMALTFTCSLGVATADNIKVHAMLLGALGCNVAWGIIDGGVYLLARLNDKGRKILILRAMREAPDLGVSRRIIADALPPAVASVMSPEQLELIRQQLRQAPEPPGLPTLARRDLIGALGIFLLSVVSTFPIVLPFMILADARLALRVSNLVAVGMMFLCGYAFGIRSGLGPWATGLAMVAVGGSLVGVAILLGG